MAESEQNQDTGGNQCPACGSPVSETARFCSNCGANLEALRAPRAGEPKPAPESAPMRPTEPIPTPVLPAAEPPPAEVETAAPQPASSKTPTPPHGTPGPFAKPRAPYAIEEPPIAEEDTRPREPVGREDVARAPAQAERGIAYAPVGELPDEEYLYEDEDEGGLPSLPWRPVVAGTVVAAIILIILALLAGAGLPTPAAPPPATSTATNTLPPLPTETATPTGTATPTATGEPTATPTDTLTPTPEFCCVTILEGDTLIPIIGRCGHQQWDVLAPTVVAINKLSSADILPPPGNEICVPWPTPAGGAPPEQPTPAGEGAGGSSANPTAQEVAAVPTGTAPAAAPDATAESAAEVATPTKTPVPSPTGTPITLSLSGFTAGAQPATIAASPTATPTIFIAEYRVQAGDTLISIALSANTDVGVLATLNPQIDWSTCNFSNPGGGPGCNPPLRENQQLSVPAPTYTPTLSPTPSGSETPTPTPTPMAPVLLSPADGEVFSAGQTVTLHWVPVGTLDPDEAYLVHVEDLTTGKIFEQVTRRHQTALPAEQVGLDDGQAHTFAWTVVVTRKGETVQILSGPHFEMRRFTWQGE